MFFIRNFKLKKKKIPLLRAAYVPGTVPWASCLFSYLNYDEIITLYLQMSKCLCLKLALCEQAH